MPFWASRRTDPGTDYIEVLAPVIRRARQVPAGTETTWVEGTMAAIGSSVTHHKPGDPLLDDAIMGAEALLALLHEMRRREL
jgi:hypothetical protein